MAPKKAKPDQNVAADLTEEQQAALQMSKRLQKLAEAQGVRLLAAASDLLTL